MVISARPATAVEVKADVPGPSWVAAHRSLVVLLSVVLVLALGGLGYLLLFSADDPGVDSASLSSSSSPAGGASSASGSSIDVTAGGSPGASFTTRPVAASPGRNPFGALTGSSTRPTDEPTSAPINVSTSGSRQTGGSSGQSTATGPRTTTVTVTSGGSLFLGLYGWSSDGRPLFRVNETPLTPSAGATLAPSLVYRSKYQGKVLTCANVTYAGTQKSLCEGEVIKLR